MWTWHFLPRKTASPEEALAAFFLPEQLDPNDHCWYCSLAGQTSALDAAVKWEVNLFPKEGRYGVWTVAMLWWVEMCLAVREVHAALASTDDHRAITGRGIQASMGWKNYSDGGKNFTVSLRHLLATAFSGNTNLLLWLCYILLIPVEGSELQFWMSFDTSFKITDVVWDTV